MAHSGSDLIKINKSCKEKDLEVVKNYQKEEPWGMSCSIDLYNCKPDKILRVDTVTDFIKKLVVFIDMKPFGEPIVKDFGDAPKVAGISAMQLIETSAITAHFAKASNTAYIDIFSCKYFKPYETAFFCKDFFSAAEWSVSPVIFRF
jgi:S-adenosylmethionine/arginine decarboxylase-like enzyme